MKASSKLLPLLAALLLATGATAQGKATDDPTFAQAKSLYCAGDLDAAKASIATLTAKYPKSADVMLLSAQIVFARHQYDDAIGDYDKGLRLAKKSGDTNLTRNLYIGKAKALFGLDKYTEAKQMLDEAALKTGATQEIHLLRAIANERLGYGWQAEDDYVAAGDKVALYNFYARNGNHDKADKLVDDYVKEMDRHYDKPVATPSMSVLRLKKGETYEAVNELIHSLELSAYDEAAVHEFDQIASAYLNLSFKNYLRTVPDSGSVARAYGRLLMSKGRYAEVIDVYKSVAAKGRSLSPDCLADVVACLLHLRDFDALNALCADPSLAQAMPLLTSVVRRNMHKEASDVPANSGSAERLEAMLRSADMATVGKCISAADHDMQNGRWSMRTFATRALANEVLGNHADAVSDANKCLAIYAKRCAPDFDILYKQGADGPSVMCLPDSVSNLRSALIALAILRADDNLAADAYAQATGADTYRPELLYAAACLRSRQGRQADAVVLLSQALQAGFYDIEWLTRDPLLADARAESAFNSLVSTKAAQAKASSDLSAFNFKSITSLRPAAATAVSSSPESGLPQYAPNADQDEALRLYAAGQNREAFKQFHALITENPANGLAHLYLGLIYADEGQKGDAIASLTTALRLLPKADKANRAKAVCLVAQLMASVRGGERMAIDLVNKEIANQGPTPELLWARLNCQMSYDSGDTSDLRKVISANLSSEVNKAAYMSLAEALKSQGDLSGVTDAYTAALALAPTDDELLDLRSYAYLQAADTLSAARDACLNYIANKRNLSRDMLMQSYSHCQKAIDLLSAYASQSDIANAKVDLAIRTGRADEAYRLSKQLAGVSPLLKARALMGVGLYRQAKDLLLSADSLATDPENLIALAQAYAHMGKLPAAHAYLNKAAALNPTNPLIYAAQAEVSLTEDNLAAATAYADTASMLNPSSALMQTLRICVSQGDLESAATLASFISVLWAPDSTMLLQSRQTKEKAELMSRPADHKTVSTSSYDDDEELVDEDVLADDDDDEYYFSPAAQKSYGEVHSLINRLIMWNGQYIGLLPSCAIGYYVFSAALARDVVVFSLGVDLAQKSGTADDWFYIALAYAVMGSDQLATDALSTAFDRGFCHFHMIDDAPEFEPHKESDKFNDMVARRKNEHVKRIANLKNH